MTVKVAASARALGLAVHVIEAGDRLMSRTVTPAVAAYMLEHHCTKWIDIRLRESVTAIEGEARAVGVRLVGGTTITADLVVVAMGVVPNIELAEIAGLVVDRGIFVDEMLHTSDPDIFALGDCARYPSVHDGGMLRLESVQNAVDQARSAAASVLGSLKPYASLPWF